MRGGPPPESHRPSKGCPDAPTPGSLPGMHLSFSCDSQPFLGASLEWGGAYSSQFPSLGRWGGRVQPQAAHSCRPHWQLPSATGKKLAQGLDPSGGPEARDRMKQGDQAELVSFDLGTSWLRASCGASRGPRCSDTVDPPLPHSTCSLTGPHLPAPVRHTCTPPCLPESVPRELGCDAPSRHPRLVFCVPTGWSQAEPLGSYFSKP